MAEIRIWGVDAGNFAEGKLIWSALNALSSAKQTPCSSVDLSELVLMRPYALTAIAALGALSNRSASLKVPLTQEARDYVIRSGLLQFFSTSDQSDLGLSPRAVPVRQITAVSNTFADEITRAWDLEFQGMPVGLRPRLADHLDEMVRNALAHSESPIGCLVAAQVYPARRLVEVSILDAGQTIRGHLVKNPEHADIADDALAIIAATGEGVTGTRAGTLNKLGEPNSGIGLFELRRYCESGGGECSIASGGAIVVFGRSQGPIIKPFAGGFPGCLINIQFNA